jgi:hypothetical protein
VRASKLPRLAARSGPQPDENAGLPPPAAALAPLVGAESGSALVLAAGGGGSRNTSDVVPLRESSFNAVDARGQAFATVFDRSSEVLIQEHPVDPGVCAAFFEPEPDNPQQLFGCHKRTAAQELKKWASQSQTIPARVGNGLPEPVSYPRSCGALCAIANTHCALQFHSPVRSGLLALARAHSVGKQLAFVARADLVVAGELFEGDLLHTVLFFCITTGQGRRGRFPDTAMFGRLMVQSGSSASPYQGVRLRHRRRAFLPPLPRLRCTLR